MTLRLGGHLVMAMVGHAVQVHPIEACGILAGPKGGAPACHFPMVNVLASEMRFAFSPDEQLRVWAKLDVFGWDPLVIYHSHTASPAAPSRYDHAHSHEQNAHYVIISTAADEPTMRAWKRVGESLVEVHIEIT